MEVLLVTASLAIRFYRSFGSGAATPSSAGGLLQPPASKHAPPPAASSQSQGAVAARYAALRLCNFYVIVHKSIANILYSFEILTHTFCKGQKQFF
jgi:hypothetical protein